MAGPLPDHITRPDFAVSVRGYDRAQVDAYFGRVLEWLADAENRAAAAERSRESLARDLADLRATVSMLEEQSGIPGPQSMSAFTERMEEVMQSALGAAHDLRAEAEREARRRREEAAAESNRLLSEARATAAQVVGGAHDAEREIEQRIDRLRVVHSDALAVLFDLQRRIAEIAGQEPPAADGDGDLGTPGVEEDGNVVEHVAEESRPTAGTERADGGTTGSGMADIGTEASEDPDRTLEWGRLPAASVAGLEALRVPDEESEDARDDTDEVMVETDRAGTRGKAAEDASLVVPTAPTTVQPRTR